MSTEQEQVQTFGTGIGQDTCPECGRTFGHSAFLDHLFANKECMRRYWKEEEKTHVYRLRHRVKANIRR
ncbi:MAG TPA: hypothetical protein VFF30_17285 [Nitrososphaerales archaeon]|nr:hypothetical protein [Nitrososphaerales archaeon]